MLKPTTLLFTAFFALSACDATRGGSGALTSGEPVIGELFLIKGTQGIKITSVDGWQCSGSLTDEQARDTVASVFPVPLTCTNNVSGRALVSIDRQSTNADINFRLSDGKSGNVKIGPT